MRTIVTFTALFIFLTSCQKEISNRPLPNQQDSVLTGLLKKVVSYNKNNGRMYSTKEFEYDAAGRIKYETISSWAQNGNLQEKSTIQFFRDNTGKLTRIANMPDTAAFNTYLHYNNFGQLQSAAIAKYSSYQKLDSITLEYNADGKIAAWKRWGVLNNPDKMSYYFNFEYDTKGNIFRQVLYQDTYTAGQIADDIYEPIIKTKFEYDENQNPYAGLHEITGIDWVGWGYAWFYSLHNPKKMINDYVDPSSLDDEVTLHYSYDVNGRVISFIQDQNVTEGDITEYYYY